MIYRKAPPQPARFLLRVVAAAGVGAIVSIAACGGETQQIEGSTANPDAGGPCSGDHPCGSVSCADGACGLVDAGGGFVDAGLVVDPCEGEAGPCGIMVNPDAGGGLIIDAGGNDE